MGSVDGQIVEVNPSHDDETVNRSTLCVRGHFAHDFLNSPERLTTPLIRKDGELSPVSWDKALEIISEKLISIKKENGPQSMGFLGSSKCSNEENYLFQKMARVIFETNNVDNGGYLLGQSIWKRMDERLDGGGRIKTLSSLEEAEVIFIVGADPTQSLPVLGYSLKRASRIWDIPLIVVDPRNTGLVPFSSLWLPLLPKSDSQLIDALAAILYKRKSYDTDFINRFTEGFELYGDYLSSLDLEKVSQVTGLDLEIMERAGDIIEGKKIAFIVGHGVLLQERGILTIDALINLALMTGSLGGKSMGLYLLPRENNLLGAWDMGAVPDYLPGRQPIHNDIMRKSWEQNWDVKLSPDPGLNVVRMIEEAEKGNLKALYIMGENPLRSLPQPERIRKALTNLQFLVVQDILATETAQMADVVLPGAAFSEKGGSFTNLEGRIQSFDPVVTPPGEAKPDREILDLLFNKMGYSRRDSSLERIMEEIGQQVLVYSELGKHTKESWIQERSKFRLFNPDTEGESIQFSPITPVEDVTPDDSYPFEAILGSLRYHLGSGTRTDHSARVRDFDLKGEVELSYKDGLRFNLKEGDKVSISSPYGSISREVTIKRDMRPGFVFIPMGFHGNDARLLINLTPLGETGSPGWKTCNVKIEKIED
jgi:formate dehydrogenase alpha subunit